MASCIYIPLLFELLNERFARSGCLVNCLPNKQPLASIPP
jgi:hypothetical protein